MDAHLIESLRQELASLEDELRSDPRLIKVDRLKSLLEAYAPAPPSAEQPVRVRRPIITSAHAIGSGLPPGSKAQAVKELIYELLDQYGKMHRKDILDKLVERGIMGQEKRPLDSLAAYLSEWRSEFGSDGRGVFFKITPKPENEIESEAEAYDSIASLL